MQKLKISQDVRFFDGGFLFIVSHTSPFVFGFDGFDCKLLAVIPSLHQAGGSKRTTARVSAKSGEKFKIAHSDITRYTMR